MAQIAGLAAVTNRNTAQVVADCNVVAGCVREVLIKCGMARCSIRVCRDGCLRVRRLAMANTEPCPCLKRQQTDKQTN